MTKEASLEAVNSALSKEVRKLQEELKVADKTNMALTARVEELEKVLKPFAEALKGNWSHQPDQTMVGAGINSSDLRMYLTLGDFRRARAAITQETRDE